MRPSRHYLVSGRVQGVGYRYFVVDAARREGLTGWVRNLPDGRVEVVADGEEESLGRFEAALWRGPSRARIDDIAITGTTPQDLADGFTIR